MGRKKGLVFLSLTALFLVLFAVFSLAVKRGSMASLDFDTTVKIQGKIDTSSRLRTAAITADIMEGSVYSAGPYVSLGVVMILTLIGLYDRKRKKIRWSALFIPVMFGLLLLAELYGKSVVHHPAPPFLFIKNPASIFPDYYINEQYSYPSGHAARAVFSSIILAVVIPQLCVDALKRHRIRVILIGAGIIYYILVGISVIYLGHHWLSDVIGGWLMALSLGSIPVIFYGL